MRVTPVAKIIVRQLDRSEERDALRMLRANVLRAPLGLVFTPEDIASETNDVHLV